MYLEDFFRYPQTQFEVSNVQSILHLKYKIEHVEIPTFAVVVGSLQPLDLSPSPKKQSDHVLTWEDGLLGLGIRD